MKCDILKEVFQGTLSESDADEVMDGILDSDLASNAEALLGCSRAEWTARGQGTPWTEIANWRNDGWPKKCTSCGREIHVEEFGWWVIELNGAYCLKHIRCPNEITSKEVGQEQTIETPPQLVQKTVNLTHADGTRCNAGTQKIPKSYQPCCERFSQGTLNCEFDIRFEWWARDKTWVLRVPDGGRSGVGISFCPYCGTKLQN